MGENKIRSGRPGFTIYFDQVDAIRRLGEHSPEQGLAFFLALADYANDGTLPDDPFIGLALSGHVHQLETDCARYWHKRDRESEGGKNSAEKRKAQIAATQTEKAQPQTNGPQEKPLAWIETQDGTKPIFHSTIAPFENLIIDRYDIENLAMEYANDVHLERATKPLGEKVTISAGFREWLKENSLLKHAN